MKPITLAIAIALCFALVSVSAFAGHDALEKEYQRVWCKDKGVTEYRLDDATRVDCLTKTHAVEFDFAAKWAECCGQALYYGIKTGKKPACVLIIELKGDEKHVPKLKAVADRYKIRVELIYAPNWKEK